jgi:acyl-[acyl carrier protein]--UDP-N-acetylglucosamine O-acyltransferase
LALQIGHNVVIGRSCMLCGQVGIAGSVTYVTSDQFFSILYFSYEV